MTFDFPRLEPFWSRSWNKSTPGCRKHLIHQLTNSELHGIWALSYKRIGPPRFIDSVGLYLYALWFYLTHIMVFKNDAIISYRVLLQFRHINKRTQRGKKQYLGGGEYVDSQRENCCKIHHYEQESII